MDFSSFTLELIRSSGPFYSWMEARRLEWSPLMGARLKYLLEGRAFVLLCDEERSWYEEYFLQNINAKLSARPALPFFSLKSLFKGTLQKNDDIPLINDMLDIAFPNGFVYFYIGKFSDIKASLAKSREDSLFWLFDEQIQNSFSLSSYDKDLDMKLITLFKLMNKSIDAILFSKVSL